MMENFVRDLRASIRTLATKPVCRGGHVVRRYRDEHSNFQRRERCFIKGAAIPAR
jgi:hypothetical protein